MVGFKVPLDTSQVVLGTILQMR